MLLIKCGKLIVVHNGTPGTAVRRAERMKLKSFTILRAEVISRHQKATSGKWYDITPRIRG